MPLAQVLRVVYHHDNYSRETTTSYRLHNSQQCSPRINKHKWHHQSLTLVTPRGKLRATSLWLAAAACLGPPRTPHTARQVACCHGQGMAPMRALRTLMVAQHTGGEWSGDLRKLRKTWNCIWHYCVYSQRLEFVPPLGPSGTTNGGL